VGVGVLVCLGFVGLAAFMVGRAAVIWGDPRAAWTENWPRLGRRRSWAVTRGVVPWAAGYVWLALMMIAGLVSEGAVRFRDVAGTPRFLVPPYLRGLRHRPRTAPTAPTGPPGRRGRVRKRRRPAG
jgi:hypothetical protein